MLFFLKLNLCDCFVGVCYQESLSVWESGLQSHVKAVEMLIPGGFQLFGAKMLNNNAYM